MDLNETREEEADAGLGNGGLGRLAACFLDSMATLNIPAHGYGIRYEYGLFEQKIVNGFQTELPDKWLFKGDPWSFRCTSDIVKIHFASGSVNAVPYDYPIVGYGNKNINTLRLWKSEATNEFDLKYFNEEEYDLSVKEKNVAEDISRVLYPNDSTNEGKNLRIKQQYFFVSASLQDMIRKFKLEGGNDFDLFPQYHVVQLNDTHPAIAIPELIRLLMDEEYLSFEEAWSITTRTFAYTNHTILAEALEKWWQGLFIEELPRIYEIITMIDRKLESELVILGYSKDKIQSMKIIDKDLIKMAWLAIYGSFSVNGVAELHTNILINSTLKNWYELYPEKFNNKTNGITQRRWLLNCNPQLSSLITELLGTDEWITDLPRIKELVKYANDSNVLNRFINIKNEKKKELADYISLNENIDIDVNSIFDIQIKRMHEYKRQLLNAFHILDLYYEIKDNPDKNFVPRTFIFGAKAAPGYKRAKGVIKFINEISNLIEADLEVNKIIKVIFVENYRITYAEKLFPAADISEQISTTGKEASGTGNMKFMLNGTPTIGTLDGANVEIVNEAGIDNNFIFGMTINELNKINESYNPLYYYENNSGLKRVVDTLIDGTFSDEGTGYFHELYDSLLRDFPYHKADEYFLLKDFDDYVLCQRKVSEAYKDKLDWAKKCWINMCNAGTFSSDRTIREYAQDIWNL